MKAVVLSALMFAPVCTAAPAALPLMPRPSDYTLQWWAEGFPGRVKGAPWLRCIQTGSYAFVLDTAKMSVPHFGPVAGGLGYAEAARADNSAWKQLPAAELALTIRVEGKTYRCVGGGAWTEHRGPRIVESGRFLQRSDVTDLVFAADDGERLNVEARFETVAWPDRLALVLSARPGLAAVPPLDDGSGRAGGGLAVTKPREHWADARMEISLGTPKGVLKRSAALTADPEAFQEVSLSFDPVSFTESPPADGLTVHAAEIPSGAARPVDYDATRGWHRVNLDGIIPTVVGAEKHDRNNSIERVKLQLANATRHEQTARLLFEKTSGGFRQGIGSPVTGMSAMLRDAGGQPTGIPVQLSKNWHNRFTDLPYWGMWFHGFSQVRLAPGAKVELELTLCYGHWGGVAAASHAQLSLVGWGSNQLWDQSAIGAWGESICYEPDQAQAECLITDVRPLMVNSVSNNQPWGWTHNVGGGDFFRFFDGQGNRVFPTRMRTARVKQGPCLTEVTHAGELGDGIEHAATVSLSRTNDIVRGVYQLRLDVREPVDFSRFVIFQIGADTYSYTGERKMAFGNENGLVKEWETQWGGDTNRTQPLECTGRIPWISLHEGGGEPFQSGSSDATPNPAGKAAKPVGSWANRGIVIRSWKARLGGKPAAPWIVERGVKARGENTSTMDIVPPPEVRKLQPGDFVEATFEHLAVPQFEGDYYGPNTALRAALATDGNTWRMIYREAVGNDRHVEMKTGELAAIHPAITIRAKENAAEFTLTGGLGYVPVTFSGLTSPGGPVLTVDGRPVNQGIHGNDFWQTDFDAATRTWSHTYNIPATDAKPHSIRFSAAP
jgi:hypothetical protein